MITAGGRGWRLFPPSPTDEERAQMHIPATHAQPGRNAPAEDYFTRGVPLYHYPRTVVPPAAPAPPPPPRPISPVPVRPVRTWPRTIAVSLVLLVVAGVGTLVTSIISAWVSKQAKSQEIDS